VTVSKKEIKPFREMFEDYCNSREGCPNPDISIGCDFCAKEVTKLWLLQHKADIGNQIYSDSRVVAETVFKVLLESL